MTALIPDNISVFEDGGCFWMARVKNNDGDNLQQADLSSAKYTVWDLSDTSSASVTETSLTVSSVIFDSLQTDSRWTKDSTGYNFGWSVPASIFADGDKTYRIQVKFTPVSGSVFWLVRDFPTENTFA